MASDERSVPYVSDNIADLTDAEKIEADGLEHQDTDVVDGREVVDDRRVVDDRGVVDDRIVVDENEQRL